MPKVNDFMTLYSKYTSVHDGMPECVTASIRSISTQCPPETVAGEFCFAAVRTRADR